MKQEDLIAKETYYMNREQTKILPEGHPDAVFLLTREGVQLTREQVVKYGFEGGVIEGVGKDGKDIEKPVKTDSSLVQTTKNTITKADADKVDADETKTAEKAGKKGK